MDFEHKPQESNRNDTGKGTNGVSILYDRQRMGDHQNERFLRKQKVW